MYPKLFKFNYIIFLNRGSKMNMKMDGLLKAYDRKLKDGPKWFQKLGISHHCAILYSTKGDYIC